MPSTATSILDGLSTSVAVKAPCRTVATSNITLSGLQTISGYTTVEDDRVLVKGQTNAVDNGIYMASTGSWTRAKDADGNRDLVQGTRVIIRSATADGVEYELTTANPIVIGTTALTFTLRYGANATYDQTEAEIAAGVTPTSYAIASHDLIGYVNPARYGFLAAATGAANYTALVSANAVATQAACPLKFSKGTYAYSPSAKIDMAQDWCCDGIAVLNCSTASYSGVFFQQIGSSKISNLYMATVGTTKLGTAIRQMPTVTTDFTGYQRMEDVWIFGFAKGVEAGNAFLSVYDRCRIGSCAVGFHCVPDGSTGNGYVTTHRHNSYEYSDNDQNVLYTSTLQSRSVHFNNGGIERTGVTASTFTRVRDLQFNGLFCEGNNAIKSLILNDCSAVINGMTIIGTAGITLGTNTEIEMHGVRVAGATAVLTGGDGTQVVIMDDCQWPASGNAISYARFVARNSTVNGVYYQDYGPVASSWTGTLTGCTTSPTGSIEYSMNSDVVTLEIPAISATSNTTAATITGTMPTTIRPASTQRPLGMCTDNGVTSASVIQIETSGTLTLNFGASATFTGSGTKGVGACTVTYRIT